MLKTSDSLKNLVKPSEFLSGGLNRRAILPRHYCGMRLVIFTVGIFLFVTADLTVNHGASFGGWIYVAARWLRNSGIM